MCFVGKRGKCGGLSSPIYRVAELSAGRDISSGAVTNALFTRMALKVDQRNPEPQFDNVYDTPHFLECVDLNPPHSCS